MENEDKFKLIDYRLDRVEQAVTDLSIIKDTVLKWDAKLTGENGVSSLPKIVARIEAQGEKLIENTKRIDAVEHLARSIQRRIIFWSGAAAVIVFLFSHLIFPGLLRAVEATEKPIIYYSIPRPSSNHIITPQYYPQH